MLVLERIKTSQLSKSFILHLTVLIESIHVTLIVLLFGLQVEPIGKSAAVQGFEKGQFLVSV